MLAGLIPLPNNGPVSYISAPSLPNDWRQENIRIDHKGHCLYGSEKAVAICRAVDSKYVKINWDLYHMQISEGDLTRRLERLMPLVGHIQIAAVPTRAEPDEGEVDYRYLLKLIEKYYADLADFARQGVLFELGTRQAFTA